MQTTIQYTTNGTIQVTTTSQEVNEMDVGQYTQDLYTQYQSLITAYTDLLASKGGFEAVLNDLLTIIQTENITLPEGLDLADITTFIASHQ